MVQVIPAPNSTAFQRFLIPFRFLHTYLVSLVTLPLLLLLAYFAFLWLHNTDLVLLIIPIELVIALVIGYSAAKPRAISKYKKAVRKEQERYSRIYTPLAGLQDVYETPVSYREPDVGLNQKKDIRDLVQSEGTHLLILGLPGSGKTTVLRASLEKVLQKNDKIPVYVSMKDYNAYLLNNQRITPYDLLQLQPSEALAVLFDYIRKGSELKEIKYLSPYLPQLSKNNRLLLLCDGLNELKPELQEFVCRGLLYSMDSTQNRVIMTCRELDYREQPILQQLANHAAEALIAPLPLNKISEFVERYLTYPPAEGYTWNYSAEEITQRVKETSLRYDCANPFMLVTLMKTINGIKPEENRDINSRGRLLRAYISQALDDQLKKDGSEGLRRKDILLFLSKVACTMRRVRYRNAIRLVSVPSSEPKKVIDSRHPSGGKAYTPNPHESSGNIPGGRNVATASGMTRTVSPEELARRLLGWLDEPDLDLQTSLPTEMELGLEPIHPPYNHPDVTRFLECAKQAQVITISQNGVLSFQHELIAEYFAAEYLSRMHRKNPAVIPFGQELFDEVGSWSEPIAIWAGLVNNPLQLAERLTAWAQEKVSSRYNVLVLSLVCAGVAWKILPTTPTLLRLPTNTLGILEQFIPNDNARRKLATIFQRCADEGGAGIYGALLPLLPKDGIADLLLLLDRPVITELLIDYLVAIADKTTYSDQLEHLKAVLGRMDDAVIPQIAQLSRSGTNNNQELRAAAIDILGRIGSARSVEILVPYLGDEDKETIFPAAVNALRNLGPELALESVLGELTHTTERWHKEQIHWGALNILESFLLNHTLPSDLYQPIVNALVTVLSSSYMVDAQQKAHKMLLTQLQTDGDQQYQEIVIQSLIGSLRQHDKTKAKHAQEILAQAGSLVTSYLQDELKKSFSEVTCKRVVRVLGVLHDVRALPDIVALLGHSAPLIQQEVAIALQRFAPESIIPLIDIVLSPQANDSLRECAAHILKNIGKEQNPAIHNVCIHSLCEALARVPSYGTRYLVLVLKELGDRQSVPALITLLQQVALTNIDLASIVMQALGVFHDVQIIPPLIDILARSEPPLADQTTQLLSSFGEQALDELIARLEAKKDSMLADRIRSTLLQMQPFPHEQLLAAFTSSTDAQAEHLVTVFLVKNSEVVSFLVDRLLDPDPRVQQYVRRIVSDMPSNVTIPPLVEALNRSGEWLPILSDYLLQYQESIPYLIERLGDNARTQAAYTILLRCGEHVLPHLMQGLDNDKAQSRTRDLLVALVRQHQAILPQIVSLFDPAVSNLPTLSAQMKKQLSSVLVQELSDICLPALLQGLETQQIIDPVSDVLEELARSSHKKGTVLHAVFGALHEDARRHGAEIALIKIGEPALSGLNNLMTDPEPEIVQSTQSVLREMGPITLPLIVDAIQDDDNRRRQEVALQIFNTMPTKSITGYLVKWLCSEDQRKVEMALLLLSIRITKETGHTFEKRQVIPALLQDAQPTDSYQYVLAALILLGEKIVSKKEIANHLAYFLLKAPQQSHKVMHIFPLLGEQAIEPLTKMLDKTDPLSSLHREVAGILGVIARHERVVEYVHDLARYVATVQNTVHFEDSKRDLYLRAFGGLLASGNLGSHELADLMRQSRPASSEREFFEALFGYRKWPEIESLKMRLEGVNSNLRNEQRVSQERHEEIVRLTSNLERTRTDKELAEEEAQRRQTALQQAYDRIAMLERELHHIPLRQTGPINY